MGTRLVQPFAIREGKQAMVNWEAVNCEQMWHEISNYLDGEVDPTLRSAMEEHLKGCKHCTSLLEGMRNVTQLYGDERMMEVPAGFGRRLERRLAQNVRSGGSRWSPWSAWLIPVAALILFAGGLRIASSLASPPLKSKLAQPGHNIPPDLPVVVSDGSKIFHFAGCPFIHNKDKVQTLTAKEAIREGYVPCMRCLRKYLEPETAAARGLDADIRADADTDTDEDAPSGGQ
jgi:Putative zinc-finger